MRYVPDDNIAVTNVQREKHLVSVTDMREGIVDGSLEFDRNGFTMSSLETCMKYEDYNDHEKITNVYLPALELILNKFFPASTIDFVSYLVSLLQQLY